MKGNHRPTLDSVLRGVSDRRRRYILAQLLETDGGSVTVEGLVEYVVDREARPPSPDRDSVVLPVFRVRLPLLADSGLVDYDRGRGVVTTTARTERTRPFPEFAHGRERAVGGTVESS